MAPTMQRQMQIPMMTPIINPMLEDAGIGPIFVLQLYEVYLNWGGANG
jgi:hypothetical protein